MVQLVSQKLNFEEFNLNYGDDNRYELIDGELTEMDPTGLHEQVSDSYLITLQRLAVQTRTKLRN